MTSSSITAEIRPKNLKASDIRAQKQVPGVIYGKTQEPISIMLDGPNFLRLFRNVGTSTIVDLTVAKNSHEVLIYDTQKHPVT